MASLSEQIAAAPGQPSSVRIGVVDSVNPPVISVQGVVFSDVGFIQTFTPVAGDVVALLGQSPNSGSDPTSWLCLGAVTGEVQGYQAGEEPITFVSQTSATLNVVFPQPYPTGVVPNVHVNINSGAGATSQWHSRAINITNTGFTIFVFTAGAAGTWTNIPVGWSAFPRNA
jgi:hypothetical protein